VITCGHRFCKGCINAFTSGRWGESFKYSLLLKCHTLCITTHWLRLWKLSHSCYFSLLQWRSVQLSHWWGVIWSKRSKFVQY